MEQFFVTGIVRGDRVLLEGDQRDYAMQALRVWPDDAPVTVTYKRRRASKSQEQLGYFYGLVLPMIAEEIGDDPDVVKWDLKVKFLTRPREAVNKKTGEVRYVEYVPSIGELSTAELAKFTDDVIVWAGDFLNMHIPEPDKNWKGSREQKTEV